MSEQNERVEENSGPYYGGNWSPGGPVSVYPRDLANVPDMQPIERLRAEIKVARDMYEVVRGAEGRVDYPRLAGALAGALDNIAFYAEWAVQVRPGH